MTPRKPIPPLSVLERLISYDPTTGLLRWEITTHGYGGTIPAGKVAGTKSGRYFSVAIKGQAYRAHRIAWKLHYKTEPPDYIDHIDGNPTNNRISNLREATQSQNAINTTTVPKNSLGMTGIYLPKTKSKYRARIMVDGKLVRLGAFETAESAARAYAEAAARRHPSFIRTRGDAK